jgi:acetylornithine/succinyldiaminopimelate/putrescine aminotransferase
MAALALMGNAAFRAPFEPLPGPVTHLPYNDESGLGAIDSSVAAVIIEPVQAEGGVRVPSAGFMKALRERCNRIGALLIFDEVLTGLGRTGKLFGLEHFGVTPDIIVLAKALGGGLPLGAFCGGDKLISELAHDPPLGHITTFGGHPLSCAAGLASLEFIVREGLADRATKVGSGIMTRLKDFRAPEIAAIRGLGLLIGIEFHEASTAHHFVAQTIANGVVINWTLNAEKVVRLAPPLNVTPNEVDFALEAMRRALESVRNRGLS